MQTILGLISILFILLTIVGLIKPTWIIKVEGREKNRKNVLKLFGIPAIIFIMATGVFSPSKEIFNVDYDIHSVEESHFGNTKRYQYNVVFNEKVTKDDLIKISEEVVKKAKKETPFNALIIGFYDYPEYIEYDGYTLGSMEYVPNGNWEDASDVKTGDYSKMKFKNNIKLKSDWSKRLTKEEVKIWEAWQKLNQDKWEEIDPYDIDSYPDEDEITSDIANQFNISEDEVNSILDKQILWSM